MNATPKALMLGRLASVLVSFLVVVAFTRTTDYGTFDHGLGVGVARLFLSGGARVFLGGGFTWLVKVGVRAARED